MKKTLAKIVLTTLITSFLSLFFAATNIAFADDPIAPRPADEESAKQEAPPEKSQAEIDAAAANKEYDDKTAAATDLKNLGNALLDAIKVPCVQEYKKTDDGKFVLDQYGDPVFGGPDDGYIATRAEEPLTIDERGTTPKDDYVVRRCFQNTFKFKAPGDDNYKTSSELSKICSPDAKKLIDSGSYTNYNVQFSCKEIQMTLCKGGTSCLYGYIGSIYRYGASIVGIIAVTVIIFSGIQISASGGDPEATTAGKKRILQSILGIVVLFLSGLILYTVNPNFFVK